ncbi:DUF1343 domain-containing protein [Candidatus Marinimicrobia bacterium MT.SAG.4]|nr:DUF1343 domain-containing protein [Candidatus Marinimicrobia bacterium MT.SAG.4]
MRNFLFISFIIIFSGCGGKTGTDKSSVYNPVDKMGIHEEQMKEAEAAGVIPISDPIDVATGIDILVRDEFELLQGKRVGVITNHTGMTKNGLHIVDALHNAENVNLTAIFGPEHGVRGIDPDGKAVDSAVDPASEVTIFSLYGKTRRPTEDMIHALDVFVFDIQDVGARFYTYIYTMALAMEVAALNDKKFVVLDRPNPITGNRVEGPMLEEGFESFVGKYKLPVRHGMTVGELALMYKGEGWIKGAEKLDLEIVRMEGWRRELWFDQTNLPWINPSPSMRTLSTATLYPGTCFIEGTNLSEGRGTEYPFEKIGAPWVDAELLAKEMNSLHLEGVVFEAIEFTPKAILPSVPNPKYKDELIGGVQVRIIRRELLEPVKTGISLVYTLHRLFPENFEWSGTVDRLYGSDKLRNSVDNGVPLANIIENYSDGVNEFLEMRMKYLLYE